MKKFMILMVVTVITLGAIAFNSSNLISSDDLSTYKLVVMDKWTNQTYQETTSFTFDDTTYGLEVIYCKDFNDLLSYDALPDETLYIFDSFAFIEHKDTYKNYSIFALRPKIVDLIVAPDFDHIEKLNDIKGAVLGITSQAADEYLFKSIIDSEGLLGVSLDEVVLTDPYEKMTLLMDNYIHYAFLESPLRELANEKGGKTLYQFKNSYDAFIVPNTTDDDIMAIYNRIIDEINDDIINISPDPKKPLALTDNDEVTQIGSLLTDDLNLFIKPTTDEINRMVTYFFVTNRIDEKYTFEEIVLEGFR